MRVTMFASLSRARKVALKSGLIDVPVIQGKLREGKKARK